VGANGLRLGLVGLSEFDPPTIMSSVHSNQLDRVPIPLPETVEATAGLV
jgi:hypothetical protein